jgi:hypothetical protein
LRKENIERLIYSIKEGIDIDVLQDRQKEQSDLETILKQLCTELNEEMQHFKSHREKDLLDLMKKFFKEKYDFNIDVRNVYDISIIKEN